MSIVWATGPVTVKDVSAGLSRQRAYNTVQTTLDRLYRKSLLRRDKQSHSFVYSPRVTRSEYHRQLITSVVRELLPNDREPVLAAFIDLAAAEDGDNLTRLESLIHAKRKTESGR